jgi:stage III sporulation protein AD
MTAIRVVILCLAAALVCATLRVQRPEIATAVSLAVGLAALLMTGEAFSAISNGLHSFVRMAGFDGEMSSIVMKAAGIAIISELGVQICCDAGESALGGRIRLSSRIVMLGMAMPLIMKITDAVGVVLG